MMSTDDRDDLVGDVADALTLDQQVPWERCARLATGADREQIENLRVIERVLASRPAAGPASETVPATRLSGSALVRHAVYALIAIASLEVAATLLLLPWAWGDFSRAHGEVAVFMTTKLVGLAAGAGLHVRPAPTRRNLRPRRRRNRFSETFCRHSRARRRLFARCRSAGCPLSCRQGQRPEPAQHVAEQPPVEMPLCQE